MHLEMDPTEDLRLKINLLIQMFKRIHFALSLICLVCLSHPVLADIKVKDVKQQTIFLKQPATRIISLAPSITELLYSIDAGENIVGTVSYSDYPSQAMKIPRVGAYQALDIEKIISLSPDLIIAWLSGNNPEQIKQLQAITNIPVYYIEPSNLLELADEIIKISLLTGNEALGNKIATRFIRDIGQLKNQYTKKKKRLTLVQVWNQPLMAIAGKHYINDILSVCGMKNIFSQIETQVISPNIEDIINANPEIIISTGMKSTENLWLEGWKKWRNIKAVKNQQLYAVDPDLLVRYGLRLLQGTNKLCQIAEKARN